MNTIKIWHNPNCSKSREAMSILAKNNAKVEIVEYLITTPTKQELEDTLKMLNLTARELMRTKEDIYKELNLDKVEDENSLIDAMLKNPKLIERPVLFKNGKAIIGRPTSIIESFIC